MPVEEVRTDSESQRDVLSPVTYSLGVSISVSHVWSRLPVSTKLLVW